MDNTLNSYSLSSRDSVGPEDTQNHKLLSPSEFEPESPACNTNAVTTDSFYVIKNAVDINLWVKLPNNRLCERPFIHKPCPSGQWSSGLNLDWTFEPQTWVWSRRLFIHFLQL
uniref:Uncharacterized protein n=1 Tax=Cacopsylla melanoneura TaxID=428564 RepID=A0A8D8TWS9_9HEMI